MSHALLRNNPQRAIRIVARPIQSAATADVNVAVAPMATFQVQATGEI